MPEKKIIEAVTSTLAVIGSRIATATAGPMPGSTPTAVPSAQPTRHHSRLTGVMAAAKPLMRALKISMSEPPGGSEARQVDRQELREHPEYGGGDQRAGDHVHGPGARGARGLAGCAAQALHR